MLADLIPDVKSLNPENQILFTNKFNSVIEELYGNKQEGNFTDLVQEKSVEMKEFYNSLLVKEGKINA